VEHRVFQLAFGVDPGESLRHFTFLVDFHERHLKHVRRLGNRWQHGLSFLCVVVDIAAHEQREGTGAGFFLCSCAENLPTFSTWLGRAGPPSCVVIQLLMV